MCLCSNDGYLAPELIAPSRNILVKVLVGQVLWIGFTGL